jgi:hypothetical protein
MDPTWRSVFEEQDCSLGACAWPRSRAIAASNLTWYLVLGHISHVKLCFFLSGPFQRDT